jgi:hypothetical protein
MFFKTGEMNISNCDEAKREFLKKCFAFSAGLVFLPSRVSLPGTSDDIPDI